MADRKKMLRCAVYTRKSSEEGLEQDFNSLDAQREACEAYIASQKSEGWTLLRDHYDDGGFSGGTLQRPALQQLLADIEVTGERIRDKIAASKRKGLWMGGFVPLGYRANDRTLTIDEAEAELVRTIFRLYLDLGNVPAVEAELQRRGTKSPLRVTASGSARGGRPFGRGHLYKLLTNPLYIGEIDHKGQRYRGLHPAIIDKATWDAVQIQLQANTQGGCRRRGNAKEPSLLAGLLFDEAGRRLIATHAVKQGRRYRYYITAPQGAETGQGKAVTRISAPEIEPAVLRQVAGFLHQTTRLIDEFNLHQHDPDALNRIVEAAKHLLSELENSHGEDQREILVDLVGRVTIGGDSLLIELGRSQLAARLLGDNRQPSDGADQPIVIQLPLRVARRGVETHLIIEGESARGASRTPDPALVPSVARGHAWFDDLTSGRAPSIKAITEREGLTDRYVTRLLDLAFLSPALVDDILNGQQPADMTVEKLCQSGGAGTRTVGDGVGSAEFNVFAS